MFADALAIPDRWLNRIALYRLVVLYLSALLGVALVESWLGRLDVSARSMLGSAAVLVMACLSINALFAAVFAAPRNNDSALIAGPAHTRNDVVFLIWGATLAMASKYLLARHHLHLFNPAAIALVITGVFADRSASWWVGTSQLTPFVIACGLLLTRNIQRGGLVASFLGPAMMLSLGWSIADGAPLVRALQVGVFDSPLWFLAFVMLTEPVTLPPTRLTQTIYAVVAGLLAVPRLHPFGLYLTPEAALVLANAVSFSLGPRRKYRLSLRQAAAIGPGLVEFLYTPSTWFAYQPGQYMEWTVDHARVDRRGTRRYFTLASSPTERGLRIGVKFDEPLSSYKQALMAGARVGAPVIASQVAGDFTLPRRADRKLAFIAGGIGITPFRGMVKYLTDLGEDRDVVMLYANRHPSEILYRDVFETAQRSFHFRPVYVLSDAGSLPQGWDGEWGRIDAAMIERQISDYPERLFFVSGSPALVRSIQTALHALGVPRRRIKTDSFSGL